MSDASVSLTGKTCLVTGATSGIGAVAARELARLGGRVIVVGRDRRRCESTIGSIRWATGNNAVEHLVADLVSQGDIRRLTGQFFDRHRRLDVLVNNAGAMFERRLESADGIEMTFALNHLGYFLLTNLLLGAVKAAAPSRIVVVSSEAHRDVPAFDFADPQALGKATWRGKYTDSPARSLLYSLFKPWAHPAFMQYAHTKLANMLFTIELARRLEGTGVTVNALHPGVVATNFAAGGGLFSWFVRRFARIRGLTPAEGAKTIIYLATSPDVAGITGKYFIDAKPVEPSAAARDPAAAKRLWELSERLCGLGEKMAK